MVSRLFACADGQHPSRENIFSLRVGQSRGPGQTHAGLGQRWLPAQRRGGTQAHTYCWWARHQDRTLQTGSVCVCPDETNKFVCVCLCPHRQQPSGPPDPGCVPAWVFPQRQEAQNESLQEQGSAWGVLQQRCRALLNHCYCFFFFFLLLLTMNNNIQ